MRHVWTGVCLLLLAGGAAAAEDPLREQTHVRSESADIRRMIAEAATRSATFRGLVDAIDETDVIVYVRIRQLPSQTLEGRTGFLGVTPKRRFLAIELACPRTVDAQIATLAHELQHVVEIAHAPWVLSPRTLREYYEAIGMEVTAGPPGRMFETRAAAAIGEQVRREMNSSSTSASRH